MSQQIQFSLDMPDLRKKVNFVRNGLGASKTDLAVILVRFNVTGNKVTMFAANKEMFCRTELKVKREGEDAKDGSFSVLGSKLASLVAKAETERVSLSADDENLEVTAGFLTVNFALNDGAVLKQVETAVADHLSEEGSVINRSAFEEALMCAKSCTTSNSIRPDVTHVELRNGRMLSSDGRKIMLYSHDGFDEKIKFKCPAGTLNSLISAVKNIESDNASIIEGKAYFFLKANMNEFTLGVRKVERDFPAVEQQIEAANKPTDEISVDKKVFTSMIDGVALGLDSDEVRITLDADGSGKEAYLEISSKNSLGRRSSERASAGRTGSKPTSFPVSYKHLSDTVAVFKGDSVVDILVQADKFLIMVKDSTSDREVNTLIPFRTDSQVEQEKQERAAAEMARKKEAETVTDSAEEGTEAAAAAADDVDLDV